MKAIVLAFSIFLIIGCSDKGQEQAVEQTSIRKLDQDRSLVYEEDELMRFDLDHNTSVRDYDALKEEIVESFFDATPNNWGEFIDGVTTKINTNEKVVSLTFDACDGRPNSVDEELIHYLIEDEIPATLFIAGQWIEENEEVFMELANNPLFEIANHGYDHKPLSVNGEKAYNIRGTSSVEKAFDEVYKNQLLIYELTGNYPKYFRSGTAYYDDVSVEMLEQIGIKPVNYNILGDAGGTFTYEQIVKAFESANEGSIFLFHMNQPQSDIAKGVKEGIQLLRDKGYSFVQLQSYDEQLN